MAMQRDQFNRVMVMILAPLMASLLIPCFCCSCSYSGVQYSVGDTLWTIPPTPDYFSNWSSSIFFAIGDSLVFDFETGRFNLVQVSKPDYDRCTAFNPINIISKGPAILPLKQEGVFYFICNISNYCILGQKISITVHNYCPIHNPPSPSPSPSSSPTPTSFPPAAVPVVPSSPSVPALSPVPSPISDGNNTEAPLDAKSSGAFANRAKIGFDFRGMLIFTAGCALLVLLFGEFF
ncbi:cucumber peeling cupredoxin [Ziziphus jujuba]|uniref:Cucumber peeling cupredoxin n=1 Tax=Ziziphus jujuba TaxID=326968 RepID=A0A6P3ZCJ0_ZIZJJ|nr:cucumber peeling cupredoxin [Ziziphus jujuba]